MEPVIPACFKRESCVGSILKEKMKYYFVYIMASKKNGVLYIGMTNDLIKRVSEHKAGEFGGFTKSYNVHNLVYYETFGDINQAIAREKKLKKWNRQWKIDLIEKVNPNWKDLFDDLI